MVNFSAFYESSAGGDGLFDRHFGSLHPLHQRPEGIDVGLEHVGMAGARAAVHAVGGDHQIGVAPRGIVVHLMLEVLHHAEAARALLQYVEQALAADKAVFADVYSKYTGLPIAVTTESAKVISLGGVLDRGQVERLADAAFKQGIVQKNVVSEAGALYDDSLVRELKK